MGITGLLKALKPVCDEGAHVKQFAGKTVVIDAYSWLHKGCYVDSRAVCLGLPTSGFERYVLKKCKLLRHYGVTPLLVFDGCPLPTKAMTNQRRRKQRLENLAKADSLWEQAHRYPSGSAERERYKSWANSTYQRAATPKSQHVTQMLGALHKKGIQYIVAPYEADAQLAFMCATGAASAIISEDADITVFLNGCGIDVPLFTKMDENGTGVLVPGLARCKALACEDTGQKKGLFIRNLRLMDADMWVQMCVLSGCDYVDSLKGIGIVSAQKLILNHRAVPSKRRLERVIKHVRSKTRKTKKGGKGKGKGAPANAKASKVKGTGKAEHVHTLPHDFTLEEYIATAIKAERIFKHQRVWDNGVGAVVSMTPMPSLGSHGQGKEKYDKKKKEIDLTGEEEEEEEEQVEGLSTIMKEEEKFTSANLDYLGPHLDSIIARGIADGRIDPRTKKLRRVLGDDESSSGRRLPGSKTFSTPWRQGQNGTGNRSNNGDAHVHGLILGSTSSNANVTNSSIGPNLTGTDRNSNSEDFFSTVDLSQVASNASSFRRPPAPLSQQRQSQPQSHTPEKEKKYPLRSTPERRRLQHAEARERLRDTPERERRKLLLGLTSTSGGSSSGRPAPPKRKSILEKMFSKQENSVNSNKKRSTPEGAPLSPGNKSNKKARKWNPFALSGNVPVSSKRRLQKKTQKLKPKFKPKQKGKSAIASYFNSLK